MKRQIRIPLVFMAILSLTFISGCAKPPSGQRLHGNVDDREIQLSFLLSERLARVIPEEGTIVKKGSLVAELETVRISNDVAVARSAVAVAHAQVKIAEAAKAKSDNGSRAAAIQESRERVQGLKAKMNAALLMRDRNARLVNTGAVPQQQYDDAQAAYIALCGDYGAETNRLALLVEGDRVEDRAATAAQLAKAQAELARAQSELAVAKQKLADAKLYAPSDGIVRERLLEPGEWTAPFKPILTLALTNPRWVRCYLRETQLAEVKLNQNCRVYADGRDAPLEGWIGYISPTAEFTPKNIETDELRPTLVYETRVYVKDPEGILKLGAPVVVEL
ncbi:MAG: HlyD family efflux transporter periplasmic adaptor subunit [Kiritimatiellia bacterium]